MSSYYLTDQDVQNYGTDLIAFTQRAAADVVAPHLQNLEQQNAELQRQVATERRKRLDQEVEAAVPNYREIDNDPRWHQWLLQTDPLNGVVRQQILNDAINAGSVSRVAAFFRGFLQQVGHRSGAVQARSAMAPGRVYSRGQIKEMYELHRKGKLIGDEWAQIEQEIIRAGAEGRILGAEDVNGK
jgi:hypothetical protein